MIDLPDDDQKDPRKLKEYLQELKRKKAENLVTFCSSEHSRTVAESIDKRYNKEIAEVEEQLESLDEGELVGV